MTVPLWPQQHIGFSIVRFKVHLVWNTRHVNQSSYIWLVQGLFLCSKTAFAQRYQMWIYKCHSCLDLEIYGYGSTCFFRKTCIFLETTMVTILAYWKNFLKFDNEVLTSVYNVFSNLFHFQIGLRLWLFLHTFLFHHAIHLLQYYFNSL